MFVESSGNQQLLRPDGGGEEGSSAEGEEPLVQTDEEDVQPDSSLIGTQGDGDRLMSDLGGVPNQQS